MPARLPCPCCSLLSSCQAVMERLEGVERHQLPALQAKWEELAARWACCCSRACCLPLRTLWCTTCTVARRSEGLCAATRQHRLRLCPAAPSKGILRCCPAEHLPLRLLPPSFPSLRPPGGAGAPLSSWSRRWAGCSRRWPCWPSSASSWRRSARRPAPPAASAAALRHATCTGCCWQRPATGRACCPKPTWRRCCCHARYCWCPGAR